LAGSERSSSCQALASVQGVSPTVVAGEGGRTAHPHRLIVAAATANDFMNPIRGEGRRRYANEVCVRAGWVDGESNPARRDERQESMTERTYACRDSAADPMGRLSLLPTSTHRQDGSRRDVTLLLTVRPAAALTLACILALACVLVRLASALSLAGILTVAGVFCAGVRVEWTGDWRIEAGDQVARWCGLRRPVHETQTDSRYCRREDRV
jgi:hypothetical protein